MHLLKLSGSAGLLAVLACTFASTGTAQTRQFPTPTTPALPTGTAQSPLQRITLPSLTVGTGGNTRDVFGVAAGDLNGDGYKDVVLAAAGMVGLYSGLPHKLRYYGNLDRDFNLNLLSRDLRYLGQIRQFDVAVASATFAEKLRGRAKGLRSVISCFYETLLEGTGKRRIGDKTPNNLPYVERIDSVFPEARIVHLLRDGRDCGLSSMRSRRGIQHRNIYEVARRWSRHNAAVADFGRRHPDRYLRIRYEDLVADAESVLRSICDFLDEPYTDRLLDYRSGGFARDNVERLGHHANLGKPLMKDNVNKWVTGMSSDQVKLYESIAGDALRAFGYTAETELSGLSWRWLRLRSVAATWARELVRFARSRISLAGLAVMVPLKRLLKVDRLRDVLRARKAG